MKRIPGEKTKRIFDEFISQYLPEDIENYTYVEPFGGTFAINSFLLKRPKLSIYNDISQYDFISDIVADKFYHKDFEEIISKYDSTQTVFYLDPPYVNKEYLYKNTILHEALAERLQHIKGKFILSYEKNDKILNLYEKFNIFHYTGEYFPLRNEIIITNHSNIELRKLKLNKIENK
jgi:site-specific DNA-adenine methylase